MLLLSTMVVIRILFALPFSLFIRISSILSHLFDFFELLLLPSKLLLLLFYLFLPLLLLALFLFLLLLLDSIGVKILTIFGQATALLGLFLGDLLVEGLSVLLYRILSVFINGDLNHSVVLDFLRLVVEIFEIRVSQRFFHCDPVVRVEYQHSL
jgi:hypothetical protein